MSKMSTLMYEIQEQIELGELSFREIANALEVPFQWVDEVAKEMMEQEQYD